jgi:DNA-binding transcriptional MerR regulator
MPLTVSHIADRVAKPGTNKAALVERIRHWTRERLISPVGKRNPGTGRHRVYDESVLEDVLILNAMADLGLQVELQRIVVRLGQHARTDWGKRKTEQGTPLYLYIDIFPHRAPLPRLAYREDVNPEAEMAIVFNLTELFSRLEPETE